MKKLFFALAIVFGLQTFATDQYLQSELDSLKKIDAACDVNNDLNWESATQENAASLTGITWNSDSHKKVYSISINNKGLTGALNLRGFDVISSLYCYNNKLTSIDVTQNLMLSTIMCQNNQLTSLDITKNTILSALFCANNQLTQIDLHANTELMNTQFDGNNFTSFDVSKNTKLNQFIFNYCKVKSIDISNNPSITYLACNSNEIDSLDLSNNPNIYYLYCAYNKLEKLKLNNLTKLSDFRCNNNMIKFLDFSTSTALTTFDCCYNQLDSLDLSNCSQLSYFNCSFNKLTKLKVNNSISYNGFNCTYNYLTFTSLKDVAATQIQDFQYSPQYDIWDSKTYLLNDWVDYSAEACSINGTPCTFKFYKDSTLLETNTTGKYFAQSSGKFYATIINPELPNLKIFKGNIYYNNSELAVLKTIDASCDAHNKLNWDQIGTINISSLTGVSWSDSIPRKIQTLAISELQLKGAINLQGLDSLKFLYCYNDSLTSIEVSHNYALSEIDFSYNNITSLDLSKNNLLSMAYCNNNKLTSLVLGNNPNISEFYCNNNLLASIDFSKLTNVQYTDFSNNLLTSIDLSANTNLSYLNCRKNYLTFSSLKTFPASLIALDSNSFMYFPQKNIVDNTTYHVGDYIDYSAEALTIGANQTDFKFYNSVPSLLDENTTGKYLIQSNGDYVCSATNATFPFLTLNFNSKASTATGVDTYDNTTAPIRLYPNPVIDKVYLTKTDGVILIKIFDITGKLVLSTSDFNGGVDVSGLLSGTYIVRIVKNGKSEQTKIVKR